MSYEYSRCCDECKYFDKEMLECTRDGKLAMPYDEACEDFGGFDE